MAASRWSAFLVVGLALGAGGCSQTTTQALSEPVVTAPIVLNSAPGSTVAPTALAPAAAPGTVAATPAATPVAVAPKPVAAAPVATAPASAPKPVAAAEPEPMPTAAPAASADAEFPNINKVPTQPAGTLLPEAERARIIAELEALRAKQDKGGTGTGDSGGSADGASDLANQAETHGQAAIEQIETCSEDGALQNNPDCAPVD